MTSQKTNNQAKNNSYNYTTNTGDFGQYVVGVLFMCNGALIATGGGMLGTFLYNHGMKSAAIAYGRTQIAKGKNLMNESKFHF